MIDIDGKTYRNLEEQVEYLTEQVENQSNDHNILKNRDMANQHPIGAISGLQEKLDSFQTGITDNGTAITASNARITAIEQSVSVTTSANTIVKRDAQGHIEANSAATDTQLPNKGQVQSMISDKVLQIVEVTIAEANNKQLTADNLNKIKANPYNCIINYQALQIIFQVGTVLSQSVSYESFSFQKAQVTGIEMINAHEIKIDLTTGKFEILQLPLQKLEEIVLQTPSGNITQEQRNMIKQNFYLVVVRIPYTNLQGVKTTLDFHPMEIKGDDYNFACIAVDNPEPNKSTLYEMTVNVVNGNYSTTDMIVESYVTLRNDLATKAEVTQQIDNINAIQIWNKDTIDQGVINATLATVQTVCTNYIVTNVGRQPKSRDGLIITLTDQGNDKVQYMYTEASSEWIDIGKADPTIDLSAYYTKTEADTKFALPSQIPTNNNQLQNGAGYIKNEMNAYNYNNLANRPAIPAAQVNSDWNATSGVAMILNKPNIPDISNLLPKSTLKNSLYGVGETGQQQQIEFNYAKINGTVPRRNAAGNFEVSEPAADNECVNRLFANNTYLKKSEVPPTYTLPIANANTLGGVKAAAKSTDDTQEVKIDTNGKLWVKPASGSSYTLPIASPTVLGGVKAAAKGVDDADEVTVDANGKLWVKHFVLREWYGTEVIFTDINDGEEFSTVLYLFSQERFINNLTYSQFIDHLQNIIDRRVLTMFLYNQVGGGKTIISFSEDGIIYLEQNGDTFDIKLLPDDEIKIQTLGADNIYTINK